MTLPAYHEHVLNAALEHAAAGWPVFPVHGVQDGHCTCGDPACEDPAKHPLTSHGLLDATTDVSRIREWFARWPAANLGLATGRAAGVFVVDVDVPDGLATIDRVEATNDMLPGTLVVRTGSGGLHLFYAYPKRAEVKTGTNVLGPGVDVRGRGGYVILPRSRHISGGTYRWARTDDNPDFWHIAPSPAWLTALVMARPEQRARPATFPRTAGTDDGGAISEGGRNSTLTSKGGAMRRAGFTEAEIETALLRLNADRCRPPLPESEVAKIAHSVGRYQPAAPMAPKPGAFKPILIVGGKVVA